MKSFGNINFRSTIRIVIIYFLFAMLWIFYSDKVLLTATQDAELYAMISTYKGYLFVGITSLLLYILIHSKFSKIIAFQERQAENEQRLKYVLKGADLGYWDWDYITGEHLVNDKWLNILGLKRSDIKNHVSDWSKLIHPDDKQIGLDAITQTIKDNQPYTIEFRMRHEKGHWVWIEGSGAVVNRSHDGAPIRIAGTHKDITFRKMAEEKINFLAYNDALTQLPNRTYLKKTLEKNFKNKQQKPFAFLFLDLDYFKNINDAFGHNFGDQVIQTVALRFKESLDEKDFIARVGGDEFVILTYDIANVKSLCMKLAAKIEQPFHIQNEVFSLGISIGITLFPDDGTTFETLFKNADTAMYSAKSKGKNRYIFYTEQMGDTALKLTKMDIEIKHAIDHDEFFLQFQPQIDLHTGQIKGAEALVRWNHPQKGLIPPLEFIPRAEETRLMVPLGKLILKKAFTQIQEWQKHHLFEGKLAINISRVQLEEGDFISTIKSLLLETKVDAGLIELEVTESAIMKNEGLLITTLKKLQALGLSISIDDFGTGYSSLNSIKTLPIDTLKIDRTFIKDTPHDSDDCAITTVIITLAKQLGLKAIAEGIETEAQKEFLLQQGCTTAQGYLLAKPMNKEEFEEFCHQKVLKSKEEPFH